MRSSNWGNGLATGLSKALANILGLKASDRLQLLSIRSGHFAIGRGERRQRAVERMRARALPIPNDYAFDRQDANAR